MRLTLWYLHPNAQEPTIAGHFKPELWYSVWLESMVNENLECIWFFTMETTDIWELV